MQLELARCGNSHFIISNINKWVKFIKLKYIIISLLYKPFIKQLFNVKLQLMVINSYNCLMNGI